jgi:Flp pilus assembly pilin Flp
MARTMIIVWSWCSSGLGEGIWHTTANNSKDQLICKDILASKDAMTFLEETMKEQERAGNELMIFLHRQHGYHQEHLQALTEKATPTFNNRFKCFLFGEGADVIYLTNHPRGLLGTSGTFEAQALFSNESIALSAVADAQRKVLHASHFNYVWNSYQLALQRLVFELKEDLLSTLGEYLTAEQFPPGAIYQILSEPVHRLLLLRLLSFNGRIRKGSGLAREIRTFERNNTRTLSFDNSRVQLKAAYGAAAVEYYTVLVGYISQHLLASGEAVSLLDLRKKFDELLDLLPGRTYNS